MERLTGAAPRHAPSWRWWVTGLLLTATAINYMDRITLGSASVRVTREMGMSDLQYGNLELAFGWAFAVGSLGFGFLADAMKVRLLYPAAVACWSLAGIAAGLTHTYSSLLICRIALGLFEAAHWPCALKTTFSLLNDRERTFGNSILQSGASIGSLIAPQIIRISIGLPHGSWRLGFIAVGALGLLWTGLWFFVIRPGDLDQASAPETRGDLAGLRRIVTGRRFWALALLLVGIQIPWHILRVWLMKFLQTERGYSETFALNFNSLYYLATDAGCILAGIVSLKLVSRFGLSPHRARRRVYAGAAAATSLTVLIPRLPAGPLLLAVLLVIGAGALALFPCHYSFNQELSGRHIGRITGVLGLWVWAVTSPLQSGFGWLAERLHTYDTGLLLAGLTPWLGVLTMKLWWDSAPPPYPAAATAPATPH